MVWYQNTDGEGTFSVGLNISTIAVGAIMVTAADLDSDGDVDVVSASFNDSRVTWYNNTNGEGLFSTGVDVTSDADKPT